MDDREFELKLGRLMKQDLSTGTEAFREALLGRCLSVLGAKDSGVEIPDEALDLLAAAGDSGAFGFIGSDARARIDNDSNSGRLV